MPKEEDKKNGGGLTAAGASAGAGLMTELAAELGTEKLIEGHHFKPKKALAVAGLSGLAGYGAGAGVQKILDMKEKKAKNKKSHP
jgi:hypothetical protein